MPTFCRSNSSQQVAKRLYAAIGEGIVVGFDAGGGVAVRVGVAFPILQQLVPLLLLQVLPKWWSRLVHNGRLSRGNASQGENT